MVDIGQPLCDLTLGNVSRLIHLGEVSAVRVTESVLTRVRDLEPELHAFITVDEAGAIRAANAADQALAAGVDLGPMHGIPISVKDQFATRGLRTTSASRLFEDHVPDRDAGVVEKARAAGAVIIGKANMYELATGWGTFGHFPLAVNPWAPTHSPGGSSSGSAVAVAAGMGYGSVASDGGGSTRVPSNYCGVVGLKPTHGRISGSGTVPGELGPHYRQRLISMTTSATGVVARSVADAAILLEALAGPDDRDPSAQDLPIPHYVDALTNEVEDLRIGVLWRYIDGHASADNAAAFEEALRVLADAGATIVSVDPPEALERIGWMWTTIAYTEMAAQFADLFATSAHAFGPELQDRIKAGLATSGVEYFLATQARAQLRAEWLRLFSKCDVIATPTAPGASPPMLDLLERRSDLHEIGDLARYTRPYNMTGLPAITVPDGLTSDHLPLGLQVGGRPFDEATVLRVAEAFERRTPWHKVRPTIVETQAGQPITE